jgi:hypothetical protein
MMRNLCLGLALSAIVSCGTALYHHTINVSTLSGGQTQVGVFDHQQGYSRDWAHRVLGGASPAAAYSTMLTSTAAVSVGSVNDARPFEVAIAIPEVTDDGYFMLTVDAPVNRSTRQARFCSYGEYSPQPQAKTIPIVVTAAASKGDWTIDLTLDMTAAKEAMRR